jgi:hypothetical protein
VSVGEVPLRGSPAGAARGGALDVVPSRTARLGVPM